MDFFDAKLNLWWTSYGVVREAKCWRSTLNKISKRAKDEGRRLRVFCQSVSDTFEGPETCGGVESANWRLLERIRANLFYEIPRHKELDFLLLTKRPHNIKRTIRECWTAANSPELMVTDNAWFGTSVENQMTAEERIPPLLRIPARVRFLLCEPSGPLTLKDIFGLYEPEEGEYALKFGSRWKDSPDWVICGGESGPGARPMHPDWPRSLRDQCVAAGVPFFFKQWGEWCPPPDGLEYNTRDGRAGNPPAYCVGTDGQYGCFKETSGVNPVAMVRLGKHRTGRLLDGRVWNEFPEVK